jgi:hypothetical protein
MPLNLVLAALAGVPFGVALAALIFVQPPSVPLMIGSATIGLMMVLALALAAAYRAKEETMVSPPA